MKPAFLPFAQQDVPRYTSYPTAVEFRDGFPAATADQWLGGLDPELPLSVYVHVPFCQQLCWYCGCHTSIPNDYERARDYADRLVRDIGRTASVAGGKRGRVRHVHFGGGTPTFFNNIDLARVLAAIERGFGLAAGAEVAIEIDPRTMEQSRAQALADIGFNRASLGVQDFSFPVQMKINRLQPPGLVATCMDRLRHAGFRSINFDLMYGLPAQTCGSVVETAKRAAAMRPDRFSVFGYAHVPWFKKNQRMIADADLPGVEERHDQARAIGETLVDHGYEAIGLDHFALPEDGLAMAARSGALRRNFQGYTDDTTPALLAFGASAISQLPQGFFQAGRDTKTWTEAIDANRNPATRGLTLSDEDRMRGEIIEMLMCDLTVDADAIAGKWGLPLDDVGGKLAPLCAAGLAEAEGHRVTVRPENRLFLRTVAMAFDRYFMPTEKRHAKAV